MVRVSSQYFPVLDCISYSTQERDRDSHCGQGQQSVFPSFGLYIVQYTRRNSWLSLELGLAVSIFSLGLYTIQYAGRMSWLSLGLGQTVFHSFGLCIIQFRKKDIVALVMVRVSCQYFPVFDCVSYSTQERLRGSRQGQVQKSVFSVWDCIPYSYSRRMSWLYLGLGLVFSISQFWIGYHTVVQERDHGSRYGYGQQSVFSSFGLCIIQLRKKEIVALVMVRDSSQCFPVLDCISYSTQEGLRGSRYGQVQKSVFSVWYCLPYSYARMMSWLSLGLGLAVSISQFWIVYHTVAQE